MRLNLSPAVERYELFPAIADSPAVAIHARPALTDIVQQASTDDSLLEYADEISKLIEANEVATSDGKAELKSQSRFAVLLAKAIARLTVESWEGIEDPDGSPAPVTPDRVDALLDHAAIYKAYEQAYLSKWLAVQQEKNGSSLSLNGTSAGATNSAGPVPASAKSARKKPTRRKA
ncbi:MAG: hypothetical protein ACU0FH_02125 [Heliomarina sp.]|uniref:hypothetical protein n=1 Tax=Heliomarina sp. TaxID=2917556 RepID=UPI00405845B2